MGKEICFLTGSLPRSVVICLLICSCATSPDYKPIGSELTFTRIAIVTPDDIVSTAIKGNETKSEKTGKGAAYGATGGVLGGAMVGAIACGPYLYGICVIGMSAAGMVAGGAGGALYGFTGISEEDSLFIMEEMAYLRQERNFQSELAKGVNNKLPNEVVSTPGIADAQAITTVDSIEFVERDKDAVYMGG